MIMLIGSHIRFNNSNNNHHALKPASCKRLAVIEIDGINIANAKINKPIDKIIEIGDHAPPIIGKPLTTIRNIQKIEINQFIKKDHQYSEREEVPAHSVKPRRQKALYASNILVYFLLSLISFFF